MRRRNRVLQVLLSLPFLAATGRASSIFPNVTVDTGIFGTAASNNYDSATGLSQNAGSCSTGTGQTVPCGTLTSTPSANVTGLTSASVAITNGETTSPSNQISAFGSASASADLATGTVHVFASGPNCSTPDASGCASSGLAVAEIQDMVTFDNTTGAAADLNVSWTFDGSITSNGKFPSWSLTSLFCLDPAGFCAGNSANQPHNPISPTFELIDSSGSVNTRGFPSSQWLTTSFTPGADADSGTFSGVFAIPTGISSDALNAWLDTSCAIATCDFSDTGALSFGALPDGVSFTSQSGVLLSEATPEPGTWALLLCSGVLLAAGRRRKHLS